MHSTWILGQQVWQNSWHVAGGESSGKNQRYLRYRCLAQVLEQRFLLNEHPQALSVPSITYNTRSYFLVQNTTA